MCVGVGVALSKTEMVGGCLVVASQVGAICGDTSLIDLSVIIMRNSSALVSGGGGPSGWLIRSAFSSPQRIAIPLFAPVYSRDSIGSKPVAPPPNKHA